MKTSLVVLVLLLVMSVLGWSLFRRFSTHTSSPRNSDAPMIISSGVPADDPSPPIALTFANYPNYTSPAIISLAKSATAVSAKMVAYQDVPALLRLLSDPTESIDVAVVNSEWLPYLIERELLAPWETTGGDTNWKHSFIDGVTARPDDQLDRYSRPYFAYRLGVLVRQGDGPVAERIRTEAELDALGPISVCDDPLLIAAGMTALDGRGRQAVSLAYRKPRGLGTSTRPGSFQDAVQALLDGRVKGALVGGGDAARLMGQLPGLRFIPVGPSDVVRVDVLVVPRRSRHAEVARRFVEWLGTPQPAMENVQYVGYPSLLTHPECQMFIPQSIVREVQWQRTDQLTFVVDLVTPDIAEFTRWNPVRD